MNFIDRTDYPCRVMNSEAKVVLSKQGGSDKIVVSSNQLGEYVSSSNGRSGNGNNDSELNDNSTKGTEEEKAGNGKVVVDQKLLTSNEPMEHNKPATQTCVENEDMHKSTTRTEETNARKDDPENLGEAESKNIRGI